MIPITRTVRIDGEPVTYTVMGLDDYVATGGTLPDLDEYVGAIHTSSHLYLRDVLCVLGIDTYRIDPGLHVTALIADWGNLPMSVRTGVDTAV